MSKVLVIGCGGVAGVAISKCCQVSEVFTELCIASRTKSKCDALAARKAEAKTETPPITAAAVPSIGPDGKKPSFKIIKAQTAISTAENSTENRRPKNSFLKFSIEKAP